MKRKNYPLCLFSESKFRIRMTFLLSLFAVSFSQGAKGQTCNEFTSVTSANFPGASANASGCFAVPFTGIQYGACDEGNLIDANNNNSATLKFVLTSLGSKYLEVDRGGSTNFDAGTYAGFEISSSSLLDVSLFADLTISTYSGSTLLESKSGSSLLLGAGLLSNGGNRIVGFTTTQAYNRIRITQSGVSLGLVSTTNVYRAVVMKFCEGPAFPCNKSTRINSPSYPITIDESNSGIVGVGLGNSIVNSDRIIDADSLNYATINKPLVGAVSNSVNLSIKKSLSNFAASSFAGFDIETVGLLDIGALDAFTVELYNGTTLVQSSASGSLLSIGIPLVSGTGRRTVGVIASAPYNEIRLVVDYGLASVGALTATRVYGVVVQQFCVGNSLACNLPTNMTKPEFPMYVDGQNTGITGVGNVGVISDWDSAIDNSPLSYATINQAVTLLSTATFTIGDALTTYPANTFAGIDIETNSLISAALLNNYSIVLLKKGIPVQTSTLSNVLVNVGSSLLTGTVRQTIGIISDTTFDAVKLVINKPVGIDLGTTKIYGAVFERLCATTLSCAETSLLQIGSDPVIINGARTGVLGIANVGAFVEHPERLIDQDTASYTELSTVANVLSAASISVLNPIQQYPTGTFAGFIVKNNNGLLAANVLNTITINTYLHGILQESKGGSSLIDLNLLVNLLGVGNNARNIGFVTSSPFDEIQISVGSIASVLATVQVYGAFIDTRTSIGGGLYCLTAQPDLGVTYINKALDGNVSTNDEIPMGTLYGSPIAIGTNPSSSMPMISDSGTYTFITSIPGVYNFEVPVCLPNQTTDCKLTSLEITVLDPAITANPPVASTDIAITRGGAPVTIPVKANDGPGNGGGTLGIPSITNTGSSAPSNGTVSVNPSGEVIYTPNPGFFGVDEFTYIVCETPSALCDSAKVYVTVVDSSARNVTMAADDYMATLQNMPVAVSASKGVLVNDSDPENNAQTAVPKTDTIVGKGILVLAADGSYTFTPDSNFVGPVQFEYEVVDNGMPGASAKGTIHIMVEPIPDLTPAIRFLPSTIIGTSPVGIVLDVYEFSGTATRGSINVLIFKSSLYTLSFNSTTTSVSGNAVSNSLWQFDDTNPMYYKLTTNQVMNGYGSMTVGLTTTFNPNSSNGATLISTVIENNSGGENYNSNNTDDDVLIYKQQ